jgi:hypothetical protein
MMQVADLARGSLRRVEAYLGSDIVEVLLVLCYVGIVLAVQPVREVVHGSFGYVPAAKASRSVFERK